MQVAPRIPLTEELHCFVIQIRDALLPRTDAFKRELLLNTYSPLIKEGKKAQAIRNVWKKIGCGTENYSDEFLRKMVPIIHDHLSCKKAECVKTLSPYDKQCVWKARNEGVCPSEEEIKEMELDHIIPRCFVFDHLGTSNWQILTKEENRRKGDSLIAFYL